MLPFLIALCALLAVLTLANLALAVGLVKRVRELDQTVANLAADPLQPLLPPGVRIDEFTADTVDGRKLTHESLTDGTIVGFFNPTCESCHGHIPDFTATARTLGRDRALAVVRDHDDPQALEEMVKLLNGDAHVVVQSRREAVWRAFGTQATPAFCRMGPGQVIAAHGYQDKSR